MFIRYSVCPPFEVDKRGANVYNRLINIRGRKKINIMIVGRALNKIINIFTGVFGIATLVLMLVGYINNAVGGFLSPDAAMTVVNIRNYTTLLTVFCAGVEFAFKRNIILAIIFIAIIVAVAAFMIYTDIAY